MNKKNKAFTLIEVLISAAVLSLFVIGAFSLYTQGQGTINKGTWINNATNQEALMLRHITEYAQKSSYPSTVYDKVMKVNEGTQYQGRYKSIPSEVAPTACDILAFPVCKSHSGTKNENKGELEWIFLSLVMNPNYPNYANLTLSKVAKVTYPTDAKSTVVGMTVGQFNKNATKQGNMILLNDIEKVKVKKITTSSGSCINITFALSSPKDNRFKKEVKMAIMLSVDCTTF